MAEVRQLTTDSNTLVSPNSETDWNAYFDCVEKLHYRVKVSNGFTFLLLDNNQINVNKIPNFYSIKQPTEIDQLKDTEFFTINGHSLRVNADYQQTRFKRGYWLELAVQVALRKAKIDFCGNSMNLNHYAHSLGLHVDIQTENMLIECTNLTKWLGFDGMQEKINYFLKADPKHRKKWILITTSQKCIPKQIRQQIANYDITLLLTEQVANGKNHNVIAEQLTQPLITLNQQALTNTINNKLIPNNLTPKNRYQTIPNNNQVPIKHVCDLLNNLRSSGLDG
jgi:hypothetical protein